MCCVTELLRCRADCLVIFPFVFLLTTWQLSLSYFTLSFDFKNFAFIYLFMFCVPSRAGVRLGDKHPGKHSHLVSLVIVPTSSLVFTTFKTDDITYHGLKIFGSLVILSLNLFWSVVEVFSIPVSLFLWYPKTSEKSRTIAGAQHIFQSGQPSAALKTPAEDLVY